MAWAQTAPSRLHTGAAVVLRARGPQSHSQQHAASRHRHTPHSSSRACQHQLPTPSFVDPNFAPKPHVPAQADLHTQADELCLS